MKKFIGYLIVGLASFAAGGVAGWITRKKTAEVTFEEVTPEEQEAAMAADGMIQKIDRPKDIQEAIDRCFTQDDEKNDIPPEKKEKAPEGVVQMDTQKEQYFKRWKAEAIAEKYDTRSQVTPKEIVTSMETGEDDEDDLEAGMDRELLNDITNDVYGAGRAQIEEATMEDWNHWIGIPDGRYDCVEVWWFDQDNVLTDEHGDPLENPGKYMGFDVERKFNEISEETTGDPDIRVVYNHKESAIFQIIRKHASYGQRVGLEEFGHDEQLYSRDS